MFGRNVAHFAVSVLLHGSIVGLVLVFSSNTPAPAEQVYRMALADFSGPAAVPAPAPALVQPEPPKPEPVVEPPKPKPVAKEKPKPKEKAISTKKARDTPKPVEEAQPAAPPSVQMATAPVENSAGAGIGAGGPTMNIGGLAAYDVDRVDQRPAIARRVVPEYPQKARRMNVQGRVFVRLVVDTSGAPKECKIHKADPTGYFEDAALAAARKTRFIPGKVKGRAVNTVVLVPFVFALR